MIGRTTLGPRRVVIAVTVDVTQDDGSVQSVPIVDTAVDVSRSDLKAYRESWFDPQHLTFYEGEQPTWFTIRPMTRRQKEARDQLAGARAQAAFTWRCGVTSVDGYMLQDADGSQTPAPQPKLKDNGALGSMASESWVNKLDPAFEFLVGLSNMIATISEAGLPLSRPSGQASGPSASSATEPEE